MITSQSEPSRHPFATSDPIWYIRYNPGPVQKLVCCQLLVPQYPQIIICLFFGCSTIHQPQSWNENKGTHPIRTPSRKKNKYISKNMFEGPPGKWGENQEKII